MVFAIRHSSMAVSLLELRGHTLLLARIRHRLLLAQFTSSSCGSVHVEHVVLSRVVSLKC